MNSVGGCSKGKDDASENTQHVDREWVGILLSVCRTGGLVKLSCVTVPGMLGKVRKQLDYFNLVNFTGGFRLPGKVPGIFNTRYLFRQLKIEWFRCRTKLSGRNISDQSKICSAFFTQYGFTPT